MDFSKHGEVWKYGENHVCGCVFLVVGLWQWTVGQPAGKPAVNANAFYSIETFVLCACSYDNCIRPVGSGIGSAGNKELIWNIAFKNGQSQERSKDSLSAGWIILLASSSFLRKPRTLNVSSFVWACLSVRLAIYFKLLIYYFITNLKETSLAPGWWQVMEEFIIIDNGFLHPVTTYSLPPSQTNISETGNISLPNDINQGAKRLCSLLLTLVPLPHFFPLFIIHLQKNPFLAFPSRFPRGSNIYT